METFTSIKALSSKGYNQSDIARKLQIRQVYHKQRRGLPKNTSKGEHQKLHQRKITEENQKCLVGITSIMKEAWNTSERTGGQQREDSTLSFTKDCYSMKLDY